MSVPIIIAFALCVLAFGVHTFVGDREVLQLEPGKQEGKPREIWTMVRCGWHWISYDLFIASIALGLIVFSDILPHESFLIQMLAVYFAGYGAVWLLIILISKPFNKNLLKLGQWLLLWSISGLLFWGL